MAKVKEVKVLSRQKEKNKSVSEDLLSSYRGALMKVKEFFDSVGSYKMGEDIVETMKVVQSILASGEKLGKSIETLAILEKKVAADEGVNSKVRGSAELGMFE